MLSADCAGHFEDLDHAKSVAFCLLNSFQKVIFVSLIFQLMSIQDRALDSNVFRLYIKVLWTNS